MAKIICTRTEQKDFVESMAFGAHEGICPFNHTLECNGKAVLDECGNCIECKIEWEITEDTECCED